MNDVVVFEGEFTVQNAASTLERLDAECETVRQIYQEASEFQSLERAKVTLLRLERALAGAPSLRARLAVELAPADEAKIATAMDVLMLAYAPIEARTKEGGQTLGAFGKILVDDIKSLAPSQIAVVQACRKIRRSSRRLPSIAEVYEEVKAKQAALEYVRDFYLPRLERARDELVKRIERAEPRKR